MRKLTYRIKTETDRSQTIEIKEFITDRTREWTEEQYLRHRPNTIMELLSDEETEEERPLSREVELG